MFNLLLKCNQEPKKQITIEEDDKNERDRNCYYFHKTKEMIIICYLKIPNPAPLDLTNFGA